MNTLFVPLLYVICLGSHPVSQTNPAIIVLADGTVFRGVAIGASGSRAGEVVLHTALTCPHIGNVGVNTEDAESRQVFASGLVIRDLSMTVSNWRKTQSLPDYLKANNVVAIASIDTRKLTRILREKGAQNGCIATGTDEAAALKEARGFAGLAGMDLAKEVSCTQSYAWTQRVWELGVGYSEAAHTKFHVVAYDFGMKRNILRMLAERGCRITVVPAKTTAKEVLAMEPDGVFLSNGPGDPEPCDYAINATKQFLAVGVPLFGICLGLQLMGLA